MAVAVRLAEMLAIGATHRARFGIQCSCVLMLAIVLVLTLGYSCCAEDVFAGKLQATKIILNSRDFFSTVVLTTGIDSAHAKPGDILEAKLNEAIDLQPDIKLAPGTVLLGKLVNVSPARRGASSAFDSKRRFKTGGLLAVSFFEAITPANERLAISGTLLKQRHVTKTTDGIHRVVSVDNKGRLVKAEETLSQKETVGLNTLNIGYTIITLSNYPPLLISQPLVMGAIGAVNPSWGYGQPIHKDVPHARIKGFTQGVVNSLPGVPEVKAIVNKGNEVALFPGDELIVRWHALLSPPGIESVQAILVPQDKASNGQGAPLPGSIDLTAATQQAAGGSQSLH